MIDRIRGIVERRGVAISFAWGFSEATLFFFLPDIAVGAVALYGLRRGLKATAAAVAGAVLGGVTLYVVTRYAGADVRGVLDRLPAIPSRFFDESGAAIAEDGGLAVVAAPWRGIPYKVYVAEWALAGRSGFALALWTIPARALRIAGWAVLMAGAGSLHRRFRGGRRDGLLLGAYAAVWVAIYAGYFAKVGF